MIPVQIRFTRKIIEYIDRLVADGIYSNRSEAIRDATRRLVVGTVPENAAVPQTVTFDTSRFRNRKQSTDSKEF